MTKEIVVTAAIVVKDSKVLAARRKSGMHLAGYWEFPGGKLEQGETPEECLERELLEEFCITSKVGAFIGENTYDYGEKIVRLLAYNVEHITGDFKLIDHDKICWLSLNDIYTVSWAPADIPLVEIYRINTSTKSFYAKHAIEYCNESIYFEMHDLHAPFLELLPKGANILDLGCGSGRDSRAFLNQGYAVTALDGCNQMATYAENLIGQPVTVKNFQDIDFDEEFDGVWACASLLHCPKNQLAETLRRTVKALKVDGVAYFSFKWGEKEIIDEKGRYFNNYTEESLNSLLVSIPNISVINTWSQTKPLRNIEQKWINALVKKDF